MTFVFDTWQMWAWHDTGKWCRTNSNEWETALVTFLFGAKPLLEPTQDSHEQSSMKFVFRKKNENVVCKMAAMLSLNMSSSGPLFTKRTDVLPQVLAKSRKSEIKCYNYRIALKFDRHLGSAAAEVPVKFQSDWKNLNPNLAASRLREILR